MKAYILTLTMVSLLSLNGCFPYIAADVATHVAEREISHRMDEAMEEVEPPPSPGEIVAREFLAPIQAELYKLFLYVAFTGGIGYWIGIRDMEEGEWVSYEISNFRDMVIYEKAFLGREEDGSEWWQVKYYDENENSIIIEALISPEGYRVLEYLILTPEMESPLDVPVSDETHYLPVNHISWEGFEPFVKGVEKVNVPAGTFIARHAEFRHDTVRRGDWWVSDRVPGGLVKFRYYDTSTSTYVVFELSDFGKDARRELE